jgi:hypothetical protein
MRESCTYGTARGAARKSSSYRDPERQGDSEAKRLGVNAVFPGPLFLSWIFKRQTQ